MNGNRFPGERHWRTREDPLEAIWEKELVPLLEQEAQLTGLTLWEYLEDEHAGTISLQCIAHPSAPRQALESHPRTRIKLSSFASLYLLDSKAYPTSVIPHTEITIQGEVFTHLLYQFRFAYSGWRYVQIILGGESYSALADGLQSALYRAGGSPLEHRTDSLSCCFY